MSSQEVMSDSGEELMSGRHEITVLVDREEGKGEVQGTFSLGSS